MTGHLQLPPFMSAEGGTSMRAEITQDNLYLILAGKVSAVASFIADDEHISPLDALTKFYASNTYRRLEREDTKLWHLGPVALYQEYQEA